MLGYKLTPNFRLPYLAVNIADFWRRWHVSLSTWLRNHIFIPLGGSRGGRWRTARNVLLTMALGGLWHGANWTYVVWGVLHGVLLIGHRGFASLIQARSSSEESHAGVAGLCRAFLDSRPGTSLRIGLTFLCFCLTLVVFRCTTLSAGSVMLGRMLWPAAGLATPLLGRAVWLTAAAVALGHVVALRPEWRRWGLRLPGPVRGLGYASALTAALILAPGASKAFIYFQF